MLSVQLSDSMEGRTSAGLAVTPRTVRRQAALDRLQSAAKPNASTPAGGDDYLRANRWGVLGIIMMGTFMAILDSSIVNVALPHMMSTFGVDRDQIEWVATGFMLTSAVVMPFVGWLTNRISYKALYLGSLAGLHRGKRGLRHGLELRVADRRPDAAGDGRRGHPADRHGNCGRAVRAARAGKGAGHLGHGHHGRTGASGPTLGGYLTDAFSWRTIFSVNLPVGVLTLLAGMIVMRPLRARGARRPFDLFGYVFLSMAIIGGLTALSNGQVKGWHSDYIHVCEGIAVVGLVMFIAVELAVEHPLLDLRLFLIRNYILSILLAVFRAVGLFGSVFLFPIFLQNQMGYTPVQAGLWMLPNALAVGLTMPMAGRLADRYSPAVLAARGLHPGREFADRVRPPRSVVRMAHAGAAADWPRSRPGADDGAVDGGGAQRGAPPRTADGEQLPECLPEHRRRIGHRPAEHLRHELNSSSCRPAGRGVPGAIAAVRSPAGLANPGDDLPPRGRQWSPIPRPRSSLPRARALPVGPQVLGFENGFVLAGMILLAAIPLCLLLQPAAHHLKEEEKAEGAAEAEYMAE